MGIFSGGDSGDGKDKKTSKRERHKKHQLMSILHKQHMEMAENMVKAKGGYSVPETEKHVGVDATLEKLGQFRQRVRAGRVKMAAKFPSSSR